MSRTYRKHVESFESHHEWLIQEIYSGLARWSHKYLTDVEIEQCKKDLEVHRYKYNTQTCKYYENGLPKFYRQMVNKNRRRKDKREIWKSTHWDNYPEQCDLWNCKSANKWGYW